MLKEDASKILDIYYSATGIPAFYLDMSNNITRHYPKFLDYYTLMNFFDFRELLEFTDSILGRGIQNTISLNTYHIFYTHNFFIYNIVFLCSGQNLFGIIISGPILIYSPDEKRIDEILANNELPLHKRPELVNAMKKLPLASMDRIYNYGFLLLTLCKSDINWSSPTPVVHRKEEIDAELFVNITINNTLREDDRNIYESTYQFAINAKDKILHGDIIGINDLIDKYIDILWYTGSSMDVFNLLKKRCLIVCSLSCIYAIQGNAPYERMMEMLDEFLDKMEMLKTTDEIVTFMITAIKAYTHAVSIFINNTYSMHVNRVLHYIQKHYAEKITLKKLAEHAQINPVYLSSILKKETKLSLSDHINKNRVEGSILFLTYTNKSINEIAFTIGYSNQNHFSAMFKKYFGMTPLQYRRNYGRPYV